MSQIVFDRDGMETKASIKRRIAETTGFRCAVIKPLEGCFDHNVCTVVTFSVNGKGFWTDFTDWDRAEEYDDTDDTDEL